MGWMMTRVECAILLSSLTLAWPVGVERECIGSASEGIEADVILTMIPHIFIFY